jgi:hypothetical protein
MSNSIVDQKCTTEQEKKGATTKRAAGSGNAAKPEKTNGKKNGESVPVDLEDYKGARKKLRHAVKAVVKAKSEAIAKKLVTKAQEGDMHGTEMMLSLIEKKKQDKDTKKKKKRSGPNWAELLASEPEWDESMEDGRDQKAS